MIDFAENYYYGTNASIDENFDMQAAKKKAFTSVLPFILENELTQKQRICFEYKYLKNKNQEEIANLLKLTQPTVSRHISIAKDTVNKYLKYCYLALSRGIDEYDRINML